MKKKIEVEYVGMSDVVEIMKDAVSLTKLGMFASVQVSNYIAENPPIVTVYIHPGDASKLQRNEPYKYSFCFHLYSEEKYDVSAMNECKCIINNLLV